MSADAGPRFLGGSYPIDGCRHGLGEPCADFIYGQAAASLQDAADLLSRARALGPHPDPAQVQGLIDGFVDSDLVKREQETISVFRWVELVLSTHSEATPDSVERQLLTVIDADANHCGVALSAAGLYLWDAGQGMPISPASTLAAGASCVDLLEAPALFQDLAGQYTPYFALVPWVRGLGVRLLTQLATGAITPAAADLRTASSDVASHAARLRALAQARCFGSPSSPVCTIVGRSESEVLAPGLDRVIAALSEEASVLSANP